MPFNKKHRFTVGLLTAISSVTLSARFASAQAPPKFTPEGRPTAGVQVGNPTPDVVAGVTFEKNRIKRTPQMAPKSALAESRWDLLYAVTEPTGPKVAYFDWDNDYLYVAWESPKPEPVRIDLDGADDGFLRGADNLSVQINTPVSLDPDAYSTTVPVSAELWDGSRSGDQPLRSPAPLPAGAINAVAGRTNTGSYVVMVAIGKTELTGLPRTAGRKIGLRLESGAPVTPPNGMTLVSSRPFVRLVLGDRVEAKERDVRVSLKILTAKDLVAGDTLRAVLEAKNEGPNPVELTRLFVRGSQASSPFVDSATFTGLILQPGKSTKREIKSTVAPLTPVGTHVLSGGAEWAVETGAANPAAVTVAALASFDRVEPYHVTISQPKSAVFTSPERSVGGTQTVTVTLHSRVPETARAQVEFKLPLGWSVEGGDGVNRIVVLQGDGDARSLRFKVQVPGATSPGSYVVEAAVKIGDTAYSAASTIRVEAAPALKEK